MGAISQCQAVSQQFLSSIFSIPKNDGSHRFILNLKNLNKFVLTEHFKLEDIRTLCKLVMKGDFMCTIDLKNAYYLVAIQENHKKYLRFLFDNTLYEFNCLPFGLSTAPFVFTKLLKPVVEHLRKQGIRLVIYLDDIICLGSSYEECLENTKVVTNLLECVGMVINKDKSCYTPSHICEYLGFMINSKEMTLSPTPNKRKYILCMINEYLKRNTCSIRDFAKMLGKLVSVCMAIPYGFVYTKTLEREKFLQLESSNGNYEGIIEINKEIKSELLWWKNNILSKSNRIKQYNFVLEIFSDASLSGWGAHCDRQSTGGIWSDWECQQHINYLELLAAYFALRSFADQLNNCEILLRIDNTTAISYINRMGGVQYPKLNKVAKQIWQWCESRKIWIFASYIKSKDNKEADFESRNFNIDTEWELRQDCFNSIINVFGTPVVDLFASRINHKCSKYISWHRDPYAWNIDAFTINWKDLFFYAFPPFSMLLKVLHKVRIDRATGIIIFPIWPSQPWYPLLKSLIVSEVLTLGKSDELLISPFRTTHPLRLTLGACVLSGKLSKEE